MGDGWTDGWIGGWMDQLIMDGTNQSHDPWIHPSMD